MKYLLANWTSSKEIKGGCESVFQDLSEMIQKIGHKTESVTFNTAKDILGLAIARNSTRFFEVEASNIIDRYCSHYAKMFPGTRVISNAGIVNVWHKNSSVINIFNDPFKAIISKLIKFGLSGSGEYIRYGSICNFMQQRAAEGATNIAVSDFMAHEMDKMGIKADAVIPHGIDLEKFTGNPGKKGDFLAKHGVPSGAKVAVWSKTFSAVSGFHIISELAKKHKDIYWFLQFKDPVNYRPRLKNVRILQPRERHEMVDIYSMADFCINPSIVESFGLVPLEAMACNIPCILGNTGFVWEKDFEKDFEKRDYGMLVNGWSSEAYSNAIDAFYEEGPTGFSPRKHAEEFSKERWEREWKGIIGDACKPMKNTKKSK